MAEELLDIVDETGMPIGVAERDRIHREGLLHQVTHVWLFTPKGELIFQRRAKNKKTWSDKLDATVAGHVDLHESFEAAALRELLEETGVTAKPENLISITRMRSAVFEPISGTTHNAIRQVYALRYDGALADLQFQPSEASGFEALPIEPMLHLSKDQTDQFIPLLLEDSYACVYNDLWVLVRE